VLQGEQGSAKSTTARLLRELVDPSAVPLRAAPQSVRDLMISANAGWVISLDNLSHLPPWLSDALCRLSTGGGFATRELYTDEDETLLDAQRPVIVNGIDELATRSDLLDRCLLVQLPTIPPQKRRAEHDFWHDFEQQRPLILGALYDAVAVAQANVGSIRLTSLPRMADFAVWVTAAEQALGWQHGSFLTTYERNRDQGHELALDANLVAPALLTVAAEGFLGTASELLELLTARIDEKTARQKEWPANGRKLSAELTRLAPNLRALGISLDRRREPGSGRRLIAIGKDKQPTSDQTATPSQPSQPSQPPSRSELASVADGQLPVRPSPRSVTPDNTDVPTERLVQASCDGCDGCDGTAVVKKLGDVVWPDTNGLDPEQAILAYCDAWVEQGFATWTQEDDASPNMPEERERSSSVASPSPRRHCLGWRLPLPKPPRRSESHETSSTSTSSPSSESSAAAAAASCQSASSSAGSTAKRPGRFARSVDDVSAVVDVCRHPI
jgi:hypothetical protein